MEQRREGRGIKVRAHWNPHRSTQDNATKPSIPLYRKYRDVYRHSAKKYRDIIFCPYRAALIWIQTSQNLYIQLSNKKLTTKTLRMAQAGDLFTDAFPMQKPWQPIGIQTLQTLSIQLSEKQLTTTETLQITQARDCFTCSKLNGKGTNFRQSIFALLFFFKGIWWVCTNRK